MSRFRIGAAAALVALAFAACDRQDSSRAELRVTGDSVVAIMNKSFGADSLGEEVVSADCASSYVAEVEGGDSAFVKLRGGRIEYVWESTRQPLSEYEWTQQSAWQLWGDSIIRAGEPQQSQQHGFGQSVPGQEVRATVVFRYSRGNEEEVLETEPYTFVCRNL